MNRGQTAKQRQRANVWSALEPARTITHAARAFAVCSTRPWSNSVANTRPAPGRTLPSSPSGGNCAPTCRLSSCHGVASRPDCCPPHTTGSDRIQTTQANPLPTITTPHRGEMMAASAPTLGQTPAYGDESQGQAPPARSTSTRPLGTVVAGGVRRCASAYSPKIERRIQHHAGHALTQASQHHHQHRQQHAVVRRQPGQLEQHCDVRSLMNRSVPSTPNGPTTHRPLHFRSRQFGTALARSWISQPHNHRRAWRQDSVVECTLSTGSDRRKALRVATFPDELTTAQTNTQRRNAPLPTITSQRTAWATGHRRHQATPTSSIDIGCALLQHPRPIYGSKLPQQLHHTHGQRRPHIQPNRQRSKW